jgi:hypothetical protein
VDVFDIVEEGVEPRAPEDADADLLAGGRCGAQADFSFAPRAAELFFLESSPFEPDPSPFEPDPSSFEPDPESPDEPDPDSAFEPDPASLEEPEPLDDPVFWPAEVSLVSPSPEALPRDRDLESVA